MSALVTAGKLRALYDATFAGRTSGERSAALMHTSHTADELNNACREVDVIGRSPSATLDTVNGIQT